MRTLAIDSQVLYLTGLAVAFTLATFLTSRTRRVLCLPGFAGFVLAAVSVTVLLAGVALVLLP